MRTDPPAGCTRTGRENPVRKGPTDCAGSRSLGRRCMIVAMLPLLLTAVATAEAQTTGVHSDSVQVAGVANGIIAADNARDIEAVLAFYSESAVLLAPGAEPVVGRSRVRPRYESLFRDFDPAIEGHVDEIVVAESWAWVRGRNTGWLRGRSGTPNRRLNDVYLMILEKREGTWRIARLIWHSAEAAGAPLPEADSQRAGRAGAASPLAN